MSQPWDYISKIVSLGDSGTGKSSLTTRLCEGRFTTQHDVTIGVEFGSRIVPVGPPASDQLGVNNPSTRSPVAPVDASSSKCAPIQDKDQKFMKLSLWDTAGQETYKSITRSYFRGASGALLVFDKSRRKTFDAVTSWLQDLRQIADEGIVVVLVGNKSDLVPNRAGAGDTATVVSREEAERWCRQNDVMRYVETSAKTGDGVERAFLEVAERIFQRVEAGKYDLNDRRSGVKSAKASTNTNTAKVNLAINDTSAGRRDQGACSC